MRDAKFVLRTMKEVMSKSGEVAALARMVDLGSPSINMTFMIKPFDISVTFKEKIWIYR